MKALRVISGALVLGLFALPANAVVTATWTVETYAQFDAGDATNAFVTSTGEVRPGWDTKRTALEGDAVWSSLHLADGSVLLGSDVGGAIFRAQNDAAKKLVTVPGAIAIVALTQTADGSVWAGAMPGNKLWKIDVANGKATAGPTLKDTRDDLVADLGRQHRLRRHRPERQGVLDQRRQREGDLRYRRQARHRDHHDERWCGVVRHVGARARVPLRSEGRQDPRDGGLRRQRSDRDRAVSRWCRRRSERSCRDAARGG